GTNGVEQQKVNKFFDKIGNEDIWIPKTATQMKTEATIKCNPLFCFLILSSLSSCNDDTNSFLFPIYISPLLLIFYQSLRINFSLLIAIPLVYCNTNEIKNTYNSDKN